MAPFQPLQQLHEICGRGDLCVTTINLDSEIETGRTEALGLRTSGAQYDDAHSVDKDWVMKRQLDSQTTQGSDGRLVRRYVVRTQCFDRVRQLISQQLHVKLCVIEGLGTKPKWLA